MASIAVTKITSACTKEGQQINGVTITSKTVGRLSLYRRLLESGASVGREYVYSHELAALACVTPAQVRRDMMFTGGDRKSTV